MLNLLCCSIVLHAVSAACRYRLSSLLSVGCVVTAVDATGTAVAAVIAVPVVLQPCLSQCTIMTYKLVEPSRVQGDAAPVQKKCTKVYKKSLLLDA